ncbi:MULTISPECIES: NAD(P) transhydrogenase subunit alpha [unclassified Sphingomonas]|uniref:NAD(P) transhydrogenase subunit alpha n=1 Tax=unclassified Sphingomonas TaxID=196159 RepID=UPI000E72DE7A|nr:MULTISPECIES: NAD(P) transhydrogenase subunit alpha [unclassified Sphingomonas]RKE47680.1 NAD(P) transhydrogenase alpha subunit [Sphingomonas sp. PP-CC-1A-547]TCM07124.1 NAD(P) transhydrogenase alpha subunit [Sphingomonas sp. PP-CC-3G-468]
MKIAVLKEQADGERRVSATPETVKKFIALGAVLAVEAGAGDTASIADAAYSDAGASVGDRAATLAGADIVLGVQGPDPASLDGVTPGAWIVASLNPFAERARVEAYAAAGYEALAMEFMPRITRAQSMDILSSQSNLSGYKAVLDAAAEYGRAFPMMMTAAGTISAAKAFVMGVGVAGLQAIATARRLGAQVSATDVRAATREQIQSLGAKPIFVENVAGIEGEGTGGYAGEMSPEYQAAQAELVSGHIAKQDIVITTALIPGRAAPRLISAAQVASMKPGSVIVDLAVEQGGNVEGSVAGEVVVVNGVKIVGYRNVPSRLAADASALFSRNLFNFLNAFWDKDAGRPVLDAEIGDAIRLTQGGKIVNPRLLA